jgi:hypothetical protein
VANREPTITRTRRSSGALLDVIYDSLCVWLWNETRPMGVVPGTLLTMAEMVRIGRDIIGVCSPARRSRPVKKKKELRWLEGMIISTPSPCTLGT